MLRYPSSVPSQQALLAPLQSLVASVPACEDWISFTSQVNALFSTLSTGALTNLSTIARCMANVFDYLYASSTQSVYSSQYLLSLSLSARQISSNASLGASIATGTSKIVFTQSAQNALNTLSAWDPVQGYNTPNNPAQLAVTLIEGVSFG